MPQCTKSGAKKIDCIRINAPNQLSVNFEYHTRNIEILQQTDNVQGRVYTKTDDKLCMLLAKGICINEMFISEYQIQKPDTARTSQKKNNRDTVNTNIITQSRGQTH